MEADYGSPPIMWSYRALRMVSARQLCALATIAVLAGWMVPSRAHELVPPPAVCPAPGEAVHAGHRIRCVSGEEDAGDIGIEVSGTTLIAGEHGAAIVGRHEGDGDVRISVEDTRITTSGHLTGEVHAGGIDAEAGTGSVRVTLRDVDIETFGAAGEHPDHHEEETGPLGAHASRSHGAGGVSVDIEGGRIATYGVGSAGVLVSGAGELRLRARGTSVVTHGRNAHGFHGEIGDGAAGDVGMEVRDTTVMTYGDFAYGVWGDAHGDGTRGDVVLDVGASDVTTAGEKGHGILGTVRGGAEGDVAITVQGSIVTTRGDSAEAVWGTVTGDGTRGNVRIGVDGSVVTTDGEAGYGIIGSVWGGAEGDVALMVRDTTVVTRGVHSDGIRALGEGGGDVAIDLRNTDIETLSGALDEQGDTWAVGVKAEVAQSSRSGIGIAGDIDLRMSGGSIVTHGVLSRGIQGAHVSSDGLNGGDVRIATSNTWIETRGADADGILVYHAGTGRVDIRVDDGRIDASGAGSNGIRVGQVTTPETRPGRTAATGVVGRAAPIGTDGYRRQIVNVNAPVSGGTGLGAGVFLAGGGRVIVGPDGRLGAGSGVAIFSAGDSEISGGPVPRRLHVDLRPDGLRPSDLLDGTIRNDGGETVLAVNGVSLFDSTAGGRLSSRAPNGARTVALAEGFSGLDFSAADSFVSVWAPRSAVYEALPGALHRLDDGARFTGMEKQGRQGQPFWLRVSGGAGSRGGTGGTVGAAYEYGRHDVEVGMHAALSEDGSLTGALGVRRVSGSADVSAVTGGGRIEARGYGVSLGLTWRSEAGWYGTGRVSATRYSVDFESDTLGNLRDGVGALVHAVELEAGRRFGLGNGMDLTPKAWLRRSALSMDGFVDAAGARVSLREANRLVAGAGATVRTRLEGTDGGTLVLEGLLGIEGAADNRKTRVEVSRETLTASEKGSRVLLGLGATWQREELSVRTELGRSQGISTGGDADWTGRVAVGLAF